LITGQGKVAGLAGCAASAAVFGAVLLLAGEFSATDREKFAKILKLKARR